MESATHAGCKCYMMALYRAWQCESHNMVKIMALFDCIYPVLLQGMTLMGDGVKGQASTETITHYHCSVNGALLS